MYIMSLGSAANFLLNVVKESLKDVRLNGRTYQYLVMRTVKGRTAAKVDKRGIKGFRFRELQSVC